MRENRDFVVPVNILTTFAHAPFSWAARHTTVCLDNFISDPVNHISHLIKCDYLIIVFTTFRFSSAL